MTKISRVLFSAGLAASQVIMFDTASQAAQLIARRLNVYGGDWSVLIKTTRGNCPPAVRAGVRIVVGHVLSEDQSYQLNGAVTSSGAVPITISAGGQSADESGRLTRNSGGALWRSRSGECSGQ